MAYVECRTGVEHRTIDRIGAARTPVIDIIDWIGYMVYDRPFTGGDNDVLLLEWCYMRSWEDIPA